MTVHLEKLEVNQRINIAPCWTRAATAPPEFIKESGARRRYRAPLSIGTNTTFFCFVLYTSPGAKIPVEWVL